jgi:membrane-associated protease RseP (regulator of RpoE activity)
MDPVVLLLILVFAALSALLVVSNVERMVGVLFIIRSQYGIRLIDRVAGVKPGFWNFLADFSVLLSFGGVGAYYLSSNDECRVNFYRSFLILGLLFSSAVMLGASFEAGVLMFFFTGLTYFAISRVGVAALDFVFSSILFFLAASAFLEGLASLFAGVFGLPAVMIYVMGSHGFNILSARTDLPGVSPMIPSAQGGSVGVAFPGYDIFIPAWHALIALFITLVVHEGAHGVLTRVAGIRLKSTGILSFFAMPVGAFVEPDEEELKVKSSAERMRVYTMGSFANLVTGAAAVALIGIFTLSFTGLVYSDGLRVDAHMDGFPAEYVIPVGSVIYSVNGVDTSDLALYSSVAEDLRPGDRVALATSSGNYVIRLVENPEQPRRGFIGVYLRENIRLRGVIGGLLGAGIVFFILESMGWIAFFNINIALVNLLPIVPFDGGRMLREVVETLRLSDLDTRRVLYSVVLVTALLFIINMIPLFRMLLGFLAAHIVLPI